ncbi:MAG: hypothetical protein M3501_10160 [Actinomycetota bacterium]|nr:hypothetical protein [Actinomycetota bacterium]
MTTRQTAFLRLGEASQALLGENTRNSRERLRRLVDAGDVACVRVGRRGDRLIPAAEVERLATEAEATRHRAAAARSA